MGGTLSSQNESALDGRSVQAVSPALADALGTGVTLNLRVLLRGERESGKTCLLCALTEEPLPLEYERTPELKVSQFVWKPEGFDGAVKVELWDVVDVADSSSTKGRTSRHGAQAVGGVDASSVDVWRGADAMILCVDPTASDPAETLQNAVKSVEGAPAGLPVCVAATKSDKWTDDEYDIMEEWRSRLAAVFSLRRPPLVLAETCCGSKEGLSGTRSFLKGALLAATARVVERQIKSVENEVARLKDRLRSGGPGLDGEYRQFCIAWARRTRGGASSSKPGAPNRKAEPRSESTARAGTSAAQRDRPVSAQKSGGGPRESTVKPEEQEKVVGKRTRQSPRPVALYTGDKNAPDLGKTVQAFNSGTLDESFFDDVQDDEEENFYDETGDSDVGSDRPEVDLTGALGDSD